MSKLKIIALYVFRTFIAITTPIWILPYVIYMVRKERKEYGKID